MANNDVNLFDIDGSDEREVAARRSVPHPNIGSELTDIPDEERDYVLGQLEPVQNQASSQNVNVSFTNVGSTERLTTQITGFEVDTSTERSGDKPHGSLRSVITEDSEVFVSGESYMLEVTIRFGERDRILFLDRIQIDSTNIDIDAGPMNVSVIQYIRWSKWQPPEPPKRTKTKSSSSSS